MTLEDILRAIDANSGILTAAGLGAIFFWVKAVFTGRMRK